MYQSNTTVWYLKYQRLVHKIPALGIFRTKAWYFMYQWLVFLISYLHNRRLKQECKRKTVL